MTFIRTADDVALFCRDWGAGPPVVFCAAWALSGISWQYQMMAVADSGRRALSYDRRGHGHSDDPGRGYDYDTLADDLAAVLESFDLQGVTLVAHSMGSGEAVRYLSRHRDRVDGLVLVAPTTPFLLETADNPDGVDAGFFADRRDEWRRDFAGWISENEAAYFGDGQPGCVVSPLLRDWTKADMLSTSLYAAIEFQRCAVMTDFRDELSGLRVPTLVVHGDADASAPLPLTGSRTAALVPGCRLTVYENAPHALYLTHRARLNHDLLGFVNELSTPAATSSVATSAPA